MTITTMKKIEIEAGASIEIALNRLKEHAKLKGEPYCCDFNEHEITSKDTLDEAYLRIIGMTKTEYDAKLQADHDDFKRREEEHKANIPNLIKEWIEKGHAILAPEYRELWDKIVPIRLGDLYRGMELGCTLDIIEILDKSDNLEDVFKEAKEKMISQGHSGMSWGLMKSMLRVLHKHGDNFCSRLG